MSFDNPRMPDASSCSRPLLGCHLSIARGLTAAIDEAEDLGNDALQIFTHNTSAWRMKPIAPDRATRFVAHRDASRVEFLVVHTMYLLNLASPKKALWDRSTDALIEEIRRAALLGADAVVTHLGAHTGSGTNRGIGRIVRALDRVFVSGVFEEVPGPRLFLENTAGGGTTIGGSFDELAAILDGVAFDERIGICLDSAHAFAAGYDLRTEEAVEATVTSFDEALGIERLGLLHLNDSKYACGARRDRHEHIGFGEIGRAGLGALAWRCCAIGVPVILETPKEIDGREDGDRMNLATVRGLLDRGASEEAA